MIPFLGMGTDQVVESEVGDPVTGNKVMFVTEDGTEKDIELLIPMTILLQCTYIRTC